jgi:hypothetical protein
MRRALVLQVPVRAFALHNEQDDERVTLHVRDHAVVADAKSVRVVAGQMFAEREGIGPDPSGSNRSESAARIQAPDLSETRPLGLPEAALAAEWRGQGARACSIAPLDYRTRPDLRLSALGRPAQPADPNADSPRPARQGDGPFAYLRTLVAVDYARASAERPPAHHLSVEVLLDIDGWRHWGRAASPTSPGQ